MADGYARASNKPGVIIAGQNGPGATNLVTGVAQAKAAFSPVVAIAGSYSTKDKMEDAFQGLDQQSLFTPITKKTWTVKNTKIIPNVISDAFSLAMKPRRGPVCINLPRNILAATNTYKINTNRSSFENDSSLKGSNEKIKNHPKIKSTRQQGIIFAIDFHVKTDRYGDLRYKLFDFYMSKGVYLRPLGNTVYILAPFIISKNQLDKIYHVIEESLNLF